MLKLMKFYAQWCPPCKKMAPIFEKIKNSTADVVFEEVDIDSDPDKASQFKIMAVPTIVFVKDGVEVYRATGITSENNIVNKINELK